MSGGVSVWGSLFWGVSVQGGVSVCKMYKTADLEQLKCPCF